VIAALVLATMVTPARSGARPHPRGPEVRAGSAPAGRVLQRSEVAILEGDADIVTAVGRGGYAISDDVDDDDRAAIARRFFSRYPDEFDEIVVFLTFPDFASFDASAYFVRVKNDVSGIGIAAADRTAEYGSAGALHGFINMHTSWQYGATIDDLSDPGRPLYGTLAQEFSHRWLAYLRYEDAGGAANDGMLGRDGAHWSALLDAEGSVQDGYDWTDNGDGSFTSTSRMTAFSPLDLYAMGLLPALDVPSWFLIEDATLLDGTTPVAATDVPAVGTTILGTRTDISLSDVIAAHGARVPDAAGSPQSFRIAFVLLTHPGQPAELVLDEAAKVDAIRRTWEEQVFSAMTGGLGRMCTRLSAPCGSPGARPVAVSVDDSTGNANGVLEPGEPASLRVDLRNESDTAADSVAVSASFDAAGLSAESAATGPIAAGAATTVPLATTVSDTAACGVTTMVEVQAAAGTHTYRGAFWLDVGEGAFVRETFTIDEGWTVDPDGTDTATEGAFERGVAEASGTPVVVQPARDRSGDGFSFVTGAAAHDDPELGDLDGETTLQSPAWDLSAIVEPVLRFDAWFFAFDFDDFTRDPAAEDALIVEASAEAEDWQEIDRLDLPALEWTRREIALDELASPSTRIRFRAGDRGADNTVEVLLDDVEIRGLTEGCTDPPAEPPPPGETPTQTGCGCSAGHRPGGSLAFVLAFAALLATRRRP
jgi:hypothetical protein